MRPPGLLNPGLLCSLQLIDKYDEPVINVEAINAIKNLFGGLGKK